MSLISIVDDSCINDIISQNKSVLITFGAPWCGACCRQLPVLEQFSEKHPDVKVCKIDIDDSPITTSKYEIRSVPTLILFVNGKPFHTKVGLVSLSALEALLK